MRSEDGALGTQLRGTARYGVVLRSSVEALHYNEPVRRITELRVRRGVASFAAA